MSRHLLRRHEWFQEFAALGYRLEPRRRSGHLLAVDPAGRPVAIVAGSPSDYRAGRNARAMLRRYHRRVYEGSTR